MSKKLEGIVLELKHFSNPLHVYCRLKDFPLTRPYARRLAQYYYGEKLFNPVIDYLELRKLKKEGIQYG